MEEKNYLLEIYKVEAEKYNKTRDIHWKMNIGIWTLLVAAVYAKHHEGFMIGPSWSQFTLGVMYVITHLGFVIKIHDSLNRSLERMRNIASNLIASGFDWQKMEQTVFENTKSNIKWRTWFLWEYWQVGVTFLLAIVFLFLTSSQK